jgi:hypothetical protein
MRGGSARADQFPMLIASPRTKIRLRPARRGALVPAAVFTVVALLAVTVLTAHGSVGAALVTGILVNAAATPLAHAAGLGRRRPLQADWPAEQPVSRLS